MREREKWKDVRPSVRPRAQGAGLDFLGRVLWAGGRFAPGRAWARARHRPPGGVTPFPFCCDTVGFFPFLLATILPLRSNVPSCPSLEKVCHLVHIYIRKSIYGIFGKQLWQYEIDCFVHALSCEHLDPLFFLRSISFPPTTTTDLRASTSLHEINGEA